MSPFKEKPVKWDGDDQNGRYKDDGGYKYDVVAQKRVIQKETMPRYFLADTQKEAEDLYKRFEKALNGIAYSYHISTGIDRADLFNEALIGIGRAYRDWDADRGSDFRAYVLFRVKDTVNEYVKENMTSIHVPSYIRKAHNILKRLNAYSESLNVDTLTLLVSGPPEGVDDHAKTEIYDSIELLLNAAERAKIDLLKFIERIEYIPEDSEYVEMVDYDESERNTEIMDAALIVQSLSEHMSNTEIEICEGIMNDLTYAEIGEKFGKSKAWVAGKMEGLRDKILSKVSRKEI